MDNRLAIIGFGNEFGSDDGIGPRVLEALENVDLPCNAEKIYGGTDGFILLEMLKNGRPVLIVDAVRMGKRAGEITVFNLSETNYKSVESHISFHSFGFTEILHLLKQLDIQPDAKVIITSGHSEEEHLKFKMAKGYIPKPYTIKNLAELIRTTLDM